MAQVGQHQALRLVNPSMQVNLIRAAVLVLFVGTLLGCSAKEESHDVLPSEGAPKLKVPNFVKDKVKGAETNQTKKP